MKTGKSSEENVTNIKTAKMVKYQQTDTSTQKILLSTEENIADEPTMITSTEKVTSSSTEKSEPCFKTEKRCTSDNFYSGLTHVDSPASCQHVCQNDPYCQFFTWFSSMNYCGFSTECQLIEENAGQIMGPKYCEEN